MNRYNPCPYCKKGKPRYKIRCDVCQDAWLDGEKSGREALALEMKIKISDIKSMLNGGEE